MFQSCHLIGFHCLVGPGFSRRIVNFARLTFVETFFGGSFISCFFESHEN